MELTISIIILIALILLTLQNKLHKYIEYNKNILFQYRIDELENIISLLQNSTNIDKKLLNDVLNDKTWLNIKDYLYITRKNKK